MKDPLIGTLPAAPNQTGSPALAGQPQSITGAPPTTPVPQSQGQGPALAPASPGSGSANSGAPLSNAAPDQQAGAGANPKNKMDLVQDRGTPTEYWSKNIKELGSMKSLDMIGKAANAASHKTGSQAKMDPEEVRRIGVKMNEALGIGNTREEQDRAVEGIVYKPMQQQLRDEVSTGVTDEDTATMRMAMTMAQVQGAESEDDLAKILAKARKRIAGDD